MATRLLLTLFLSLIPIGIAWEDSASAQRMVVWTALVLADDQAGAQTGDAPVDRGETILPGFERFDAAQSYLSRSIEALSHSVDAFFGDDPLYDETSGTYLQFRGSGIYRRSESTDFDSQFRGRFDLPSLEKKLALIIESDTDPTIAQSALTEGQPKVSDTFDERRASASLQYIVKELKDWNVRLLPGVRLAFPPDILLKLRVRNQQKLGEFWLSRLTLTPGWYSDRGWEMRGQLDLEREIGRAARFRASSEAIWQKDDRRNFDLAQIFSFAHPVSSRDYLAYTIGVTAATSPSLTMTSYFGNVRYRRNVHRHWLYLEIKPQINFDREENFEPDPSIAVSLEVLLGSRYMANHKGG